MPTLGLRDSLFLQKSPIALKAQFDSINMMVSVNEDLQAGSQSSSIHCMTKSPLNATSGPVVNTFNQSFSVFFNGENAVNNDDGLLVSPKMNTAGIKIDVPS